MRDMDTHQETAPPEATNWDQWVERWWGGKYCTIGEAARRVGRTPRTLRRWRQKGAVRAPSWETQVGTKTVHLFDDKDIAELREYAARLESKSRAKRRS